MSTLFKKPVTKDEIAFESEDSIASNNSFTSSVDYDGNNGNKHRI